MLGLGEYPVSVDYLVALQEFAAERGVPPQDVLMDTGLPPNILIKPGIRVGHVSMDRAIRNVLIQLDDPLLPIEYGRRLTISKHGVLGFAAQSSATLMDGARLLEQYMKTRSGSGEEFALIVKPDEVCLRIYPLDQIGESRVLQFHFLSTLFSIETIARWMSGTQNTPVNVRMLFDFDFPHVIPDEMLTPGLSVSFGEAVNELRIPMDIMQQPLVNASPSLVLAAQAQCEEEMAQLSSANNISSLVRNLIRQEEGKLPTLDQVAESINMSSRTLKRRLSDAGTSYQHLKDSERFRKAMQLLETTRECLDSIADMLGYSDASNFSKAFKGWSGMLPGEYRDKFRHTDD